MAATYLDEVTADLPPAESEPDLIATSQLDEKLYLGNGCSDRKNNDIFDPNCVKEQLIGQLL